MLTAACQAASWVWTATAESEATAQGQEKQLQIRAGPCPQSCLHRKGGLRSPRSSGLPTSLLGSRDDRDHRNTGPRGATRDFQWSHLCHLDMRTHLCKALDTAVLFSDSSDFLIGLGRVSNWGRDALSTACAVGNLPD